MKQYAKLFEDFLNEDELDDILGDTGDGGGEKAGADKEKKEELGLVRKMYATPPPEATA